MAVAIEVHDNVASMQAANCLGCIHIGSTAYVFYEPQQKRAHDFGWRLELFTPLHWFRFRRAVKHQRKCEPEKTKDHSSGPSQ